MCGEASLVRLAWMHVRWAAYVEIGENYTDYEHLPGNKRLESFQNPRSKFGYSLTQEAVRMHVYCIGKSSSTSTTPPLQKIRLVVEYNQFVTRNNDSTVNCDKMPPISNNVKKAVGRIFTMLSCAGCDFLYHPV